MLAVWAIPPQILTPTLSPDAIKAYMLLIQENVCLVCVQTTAADAHGMPQLLRTVEKMVLLAL
jgi:nitrate reductase cytochrome c-type subunit